MNAQIVLENLGIHLPNRVLFEDVNFTIYDGMRVSLAGRNGSGKSTLMRILGGKAEASVGKCNFVGGKKLRVGFLDQSLLDSAVLEAVNSNDTGLTPITYILKQLEKSRFDQEREPDEYEWKIRKILSGLGFSKAWMENPLSSLSGGWLLRVFIAASLVDKPEVLLLDEPTNHLDISSIQWLEEFLQKDYEGSLILITHDISLQKRTTDSLAVLHGGRFFFRKGERDYLTFLSSLSDEKRILEKNIEAVQKRIEENMEFVYKFRAKAQTAARAQSKLKAAETLTEELRQLKDRLLRIEGYGYNLKFRFRMAAQGSKFPIAVQKLDFRYAPTTDFILHGVNFDVQRGQCLAILGDNGTGKTTLLNLIAQRLQPVSGKISHGHNVEMGYFGQHQLDELSVEDSVIDNVRVKARDVSADEMRGWLGAFGFSGDEEIQKKVKYLSGGERARLALLRILVTRVNLLLLDEPTNHLDIETKELLKNAIRDFEGTTIIVSHDREFVSGVASRILYLAQDKRWIDHIGSLETFFEKYPEFVRHAEGHALPSQAPKTTEQKKQNQPRLSFEERKKVKNAIRSLEKKIAAVESEIEKFSPEKDELHKKIELSASPEDAQSLWDRVTEIDRRIHLLMVDWEKWGSELEILNRKFGEGSED